MSRVLLSKVAAPSLPAAGKVSLYFNTTTQRLEIEDGDTLQTYPLQAAEFDKNIIINGGFDLAQRQLPGTLTSYATSANRVYAGADRWGAMIQTSSLQYQRVDTNAAPETGLQARYYGKYKQITGAGKAVLHQIVEGSSAMPLRGRKVRLQVKMKRTVAAAMTVRLGLAQLAAAGTIDTVPTAFVSAYGANGVDPTFGANIALLTPVTGTAVGGTISGLGISCVLSGSWLNYSAVFTVPTDCKNIIPVIWTDSQLAVNDELNISEAGLFDGPDVVDWIPLPLPLEMRRCQRFYHKSFDIDVAPAQNVGLTGAVRGYVSVAGAVASQPIGIRYPVPMRAAPTLTFFNPSAANAFTRNTTAGSDATATSGSTIGNQGSDIFFTGIAAWTVAQAVAVQYTADAEL